MPEQQRPRPGTGGSAGRVIAGVARGRRLVAPGAGTRPLGDRVKQSLFAIIEPEVRDGAFLDLFAGSGAAGIEALSRGARLAVFVERNASAGQFIERNLRTASLQGAAARIVKADVLSWLAGETRGGRGEGAPFDAIVIDPPYDEPQLLDRSLEAIAAAGPGEILAARRRHRRQALPGLESERPASDCYDRPAKRRFGETTLTFLPLVDRGRWRGGRMRVALYPGSFDPVTNGHLDVLERALAVFDRVVVAVLANPRKTPLLPVETRVVVLETAIRDAGIDADHASVTTFDGLTVEAARANGARWLVRGLRAISDFEAEGQLAAQQPGHRRRHRHGLLHDRRRVRLRELEPGQGDRIASEATSRAWSRRPRSRPSGPWSGSARPSR